MTTTAGDLDILKNDTDVAVGPDPSAEQLANLRALAASGATRAERSVSLFQRLRKLEGAECSALLAAIMDRALRNESDGARLLAAFLDVSTAGQRLLPLVQNLKSSRRLRLQILADPRGLSRFQKDWLRRLDALGHHSRKALVDFAPDVDETSAAASITWVSMHRALALVLERVLTRQELAAHHRRFLADLLELEIDAWQERISRLAGEVDPYRATHVARLLPILGKADVDVRDLRHLVSWVREGEDQRAFFQQRPRAAEAMEERELASFKALLSGHPALCVLNELYAGQERLPISIDDLAGGVGVLLGLGERLHQAGWMSEKPNLLSLVRRVKANLRDGEVAMPLDDHGAAVISMALQDDDTRSESAAWPLKGCSLAGGQLIIDLDQARVDTAWPDDLPLPGQTHPDLARPKAPEQTEPADALAQLESDKKADKDQSAAAIKQLVMNSLQTTSVLLGFLRNQRITSIPGLVEAVATRTRNPQILATIASDRGLYSGFANRDVPLAVLRNPSNVSVKVLRRFIHVKFISKVDLKRMALDRASMRKEVIREIEKYLDSLS